MKGGAAKRERMEAERASRAAREREAWREWLVPLALGVWVALALVKFGNPVILDEMVTAPGSAAEWIYWSWPFAWGCVISAVALLVAAWGARWDLPRRRLVLWLPALWFGWQVLAGARTVSPELTNPTLVHFGITVLAFYAGYFALARCRRLNLFWVPVLLAFGWTLLQGFDQHYGGLEATRKAFYEQPDWQSYPEEYLKKIATDRIFGTLVYPNAFAGVILLLGPVLLYQLWQLSAKWPRVSRGVASGVVGYMAVACLVWTGSKGGWLVGLAAGGVLLFLLPGKRRLKIAAVVTFGLVGLAAFFIQYREYFERGAPSVGARFDYWSAAWQTAEEHPVLGTGPGTFAIPYGKIKRPEAEMARLTHNDYLQQASDSGWLGLILYSGAIFWILWNLYRYSVSKDWLFKLVLLGLFAWVLQSFIEFGLYIPAISWTAFMLMGWGLGVTLGRDEVEKFENAKSSEPTLR